VETIHIQSFVAAPPEAVWRQLLGRPDVVLDALPVVAWPVQREERSPSRLVVSWPFGSGAALTTVEIALAPVSGGTRVDLRHEGWESGPSEQDALAGHFAGWLQALAALGLMVESGQDPRASSASLAGRERYFASAEIPAGVDAVFRALTDPEVLARWSEGALEGTELVDSLEGRYARWTVAAPAGGSPGEVVMILRRTPRGTHCAVAEYGVADRSASARWPKTLERLAQYLR
jgi:uncharacterized protein YndB with AHSA1/START domain